MLNWNITLNYHFPITLKLNNLLAPTHPFPHFPSQKKQKEKRQFKAGAMQLLGKWQGSKKTKIHTATGATLKKAGRRLLFYNPLCHVHYLKR
jgi:hypothetical protein